MAEFNNSNDKLHELSSREKMLIGILCKENNINIHDVQTRVKNKASLKTKVKSNEKKYSKLTDITDVVGIRIITYFNDDVDRMAKVVEKEFKIDKENSVDKRIIDADRFGYSSLHYIAEFSSERIKFLEYKNFKNMKFEIQIRSVLQHAWAEIEHDLGYKNKIEIPEKIRRDFSRVSGLL